MRSSFISAAFLAFASAVYAQTAGFDPITQPTQDENVPAGQPFNIVWEPSTSYTGTVTIQLLQGSSPSTLSAGQVIQSGIENSLGTYTWAVPTSLQSFATYGFTITLDSDTTIFQYSFPFHITGLSTSNAAVNSSSTSTVTMHLSTGTAYTSSSATLFLNSTTSSTTAKPTSNITLSTTIVAKTTTAPSQTSSSTSSASPTATKNAAVAQVATGSLAMIGGLVLAFAL